MSSKRDKLGLSPSRLIERGLRSAVRSGSDYIPDVVEKPLRRALDLPDLSVKPTKPEPSLAAKVETPVTPPATPKTPKSKTKKRTPKSRSTQTKRNVTANVPEQDFVNATYEIVPYSKSGHLTGIGAGDDAIRAEYSMQPELSWMDNSDRDMIYDALGVYQAPTVPATGVYKPPAGELEINKAFVGQPRVNVTGGSIDPASRDLLDFGETLRGYLGGQGASAYHATLKNAPSAEQGSLFIPMNEPVNAERLIEVGELGGTYGLPDFVDTGKGVTVTNFYPGPPSGDVTERNLRSGFGEDITRLLGSTPDRVKVDSSYLPILEAGEDPRQGVPGSGWATDQLLAMADRYPTAAAQLEGGNIRSRASAQANLDEDYAARGFGATREDLQTARRIFAERGFAGLREARRNGIALPGIAALMSLYGLQGGPDQEGNLGGGV